MIPPKQQREFEKKVTQGMSRAISETLFLVSEDLDIPIEKLVYSFATNFQKNLETQAGKKFNIPQKMKDWLESLSTEED